MTTKFRLRSKSDKKVPIKLRVSISRNQVYEINTGFLINPENWDKVKGYPKQKMDDNKVLLTKLKKLDSFISEQYLNDSPKIPIDLDWLQNCIDNFHGRVKKVEIQSDYFIEHLNKYIENSDTKKVKGKEDLGLALNTKKTYGTFKNLITSFELENNIKIKFTEINKNFIDRFTKWLLETKAYSSNYAGKQLDHIKAICKDATYYDIPVNSYFKKIEPFCENKKDRLIVTFTNEEIEKIWNTEMPTECLTNAKKWILLGIESGQRCGDLLDIDLGYSKKKDDVIIIEIYQNKPKKYVQVPFTDKRCVRIIEEDFPYKISVQKLNEYIKIVCEICKINQLIEGKKYDKILHRKVVGKFPKHELITSHSFRRTFATNWYGIMPTALIMEITGHTRESQLHDYINKRDDSKKNTNRFIEIAKQNKNSQRA
jgi:integrase